MGKPMELEEKIMHCFYKLKLTSLSLKLLHFISEFLINVVLRQTKHFSFTFIYGQHNHPRCDDSALLPRLDLRRIRSNALEGQVFRLKSKADSFSASKIIRLATRHAIYIVELTQTYGHFDIARRGVCAMTVL